MKIQDIYKKPYFLLISFNKTTLVADDYTYNR